MDASRKSAMECTYCSRPTAVAADDVESGRPRRFPDPPLPPMPHGDANASPVEAALARREGLLWDLHKVHIRQDTILRELIEMERVMGFTGSGHNSVQTLPRSHDYWHCRPFSMYPSEEVPLRPPGAGAEHPPCRCGSSTGVRAPPVYPHVELSQLPSPLLQPRPASDTEKQQDCRSSEQRMHPASGHMELCRTPSKPTTAEETPGHQHTDVGEKVDVEIRNQLSKQWKATESDIEDLVNKPIQVQHRFNQADQENAVYNEQKKTEFREYTPERTSSGLKRKLSAIGSPVKEKPLGCDLYQENPFSQRNLDEHLAGKRHYSNVAALHTSRSNTPEASPKATPVWSRIMATDARSFPQDGKENVAESRWRCNLCPAHCNRESDYYAHLGGRRHRENTEALQVELKSSSRSKDADMWKTAKLKSALYCKACDVQCSSMTMLTSHLGGRKHRETLEGRERGAGARLQPAVLVHGKLLAVWHGKETVRGLGGGLLVAACYVLVCYFVANYSSRSSIPVGYAADCCTVAGLTLFCDF
ncbi:hypothetical protein BS78_02G186000 [Paspalum vaginatum]|nr:hypothetical protein BS78_02G186000 [Paspalum vaginatum]